MFLVVLALFVDLSLTMTTISPLVLKMFGLGRNAVMEKSFSSLLGP